MRSKWVLILVVCVMAIGIYNVTVRAEEDHWEMTKGITYNIDNSQSDKGFGYFSEVVHWMNDGLGWQLGYEFFSTARDPRATQFFSNCTGVYGGLKTRFLYDLLQIKGVVGEYYHDVTFEEYTSYYWGEDYSITTLYYRGPGVILGAGIHLPVYKALNLQAMADYRFLMIRCYARTVDGEYELVEDGSYKGSVSGWRFGLALGLEF